MITGVEYDPTSGYESYQIFDPYTHARYKCSYLPEEAPKGIVMHPGNFKHFAETSKVDSRLAASYAQKTMRLHRVMEWVVGKDVEGNLLTLFSGSRPCDSANLSQGSIINFHVLDAKTLKFKQIYHWDYTKGHLWGAELLPIEQGRPLLSHWMLTSEPEQSLFNWTFKSQQYVEEDHPNVRDKWGSACTEHYNYGDLVATPSWVGMLVGECTSEKGERSLVVVDYPGRRGSNEIKYTVHPEDKVFSLAKLVDELQHVSTTASTQ